MGKMNATAACVLGLMQLGPAPGQKRHGRAGAMTGWQVHEAASVSVGRFWNLTRSQIYRELLRLEEAKLVAGVGKPGPRASRAYRVTPGGQAAFRAWLEAFTAGDPRDEILRSPLVLTVFFSEFLPPTTLRRVLVEHRARHERRLGQLRKMNAALDAATRARPPAAVLARGLAYQGMMVGWIDGLLKRE